MAPISSPLPPPSCFSQLHFAELHSLVVQGGRVSAMNMDFEEQGGEDVVSGELPDGLPDSIRWQPAESSGQAFGVYFSTDFDPSTVEGCTWRVYRHKQRPNHKVVVLTLPPPYTVSFVGTTYDARGEYTDFSTCK
jgi:hypothetical protein